MKIPKEYKNLNKYGLTPKTIKNLIPDRNKIQEKPFWRNNVISAWCLSDNTIHSSDSIVYSEEDNPDALASGKGSDDNDFRNEVPSVS